MKRKVLVLQSQASYNLTKGIAYAITKGVLAYEAIRRYYNSLRGIQTVEMEYVVNIVREKP